MTAAIEGSSKETLVPEQVDRNKIETISQIDTGPMQVANVILVLLDLKPATELTLYNWNEKPEEVRRKLEESGLVVKNKRIREDESTRVSANFAIALDENTATKLVKVEADTDHDEYGRLMGYPETAIKAFIGKDDAERLAREDYPDQSGIIFKFALSKDHFPEEVKVLRK